MRILGLIAAFFLCSVGAASAAPVLMISIDGLRPADILDAQARGVKAPYLIAMAQRGLYATGVRNALPTVTYPNHTTLVTGVWPAKHGIGANVTFDPLRQTHESWNWYAPDIRVQTLWDAVHAQHKVTGSLGWPVTVDNPSIDEDLPEYWRARTPDDAELLHALSTPKLPEIAQAANFSLMDIVFTEPADGPRRGRWRRSTRPNGPISSRFTCRAWTTSSMVSARARRRPMTLCAGSTPPWRPWSPPHDGPIRTWW